MKIKIITSDDLEYEVTSLPGEHLNYKREEGGGLAILSLRNGQIREVGYFQPGSWTKVITLD